MEVKEALAARDLRFLPRQLLRNQLGLQKELRESLKVLLGQQKGQWKQQKKSQLQRLHFQEEEDPATTSLLTEAVGQVNKIPFPYLTMGQTQRFILVPSNVKNSCPGSYSNITQIT